MTKGILAFGAYIPWRRLPRKAIADTHAWFNPGAQGPGQGRARDLQLGRGLRDHGGRGRARRLTGRDRASIAALRFASTTFPFLDRLHSGIVAGALSLDDGVSTIDVAATQRAGTSALIEALGSGGETLVVAAEKRGAKAASPVEMSSGDGAAAILVGEGKPVAKLLAKASRTADFVDHFRSRRQPVRLPVGGALDPRRGLHARSCRRRSSAAWRPAKVAAKRRHPLLHAGDAGARRQARWPRRPASTTRRCATRCTPTAATPAPRMRW